MSVVTNVLLFMPGSESRALAPVQRWLDNANMGQLTKIDRYAGGKKYMEANVWAGAFNYLDVPAFVEVVKAQRWLDPECVQLLIQEQSDCWFSCRFGKVPHLTPPPNEPS